MIDAALPLASFVDSFADAIDFILQKQPARTSATEVGYGVSWLFGSGSLGPLLISVSLLALMAAVFGKRLRSGPALTTSPADT